MDKLASHLLGKVPSSGNLMDSFHLDDSDLDSDDENDRRPPIVQPIVPIKYETLDRDKVLNAYRTTLGRLGLVWTPPGGLSPKSVCAAPAVPAASDYPETYLRNTDKEKLLIWYCENFRRQYSSRYPLRRPLVMALENECGVQKMVCTSINVTRFPLVEFKSWSGCASFVSDHIVYEPLDHPTNLPVRLRSPSTVFNGQSGAKIDAYVVSGYATREVCLNDQCRVPCPLLPPPEPSQSAPDSEQTPVSKYVPKPVPDYRSKFERMMEQRRMDEERRKREEEEEEERKLVEELERLPPDELRGKRLHSWVLVREGGEEGEVFFVEPITGRRCDLDDEQYLGVESVWNQENYWVNLQFSNTCRDLDFTLTNRKLWQPLLLSGIRPHHKLPKPKRKGKTARDSQRDDKLKALTETMKEKCLDIPVTWTEDLDITLDKYVRGRYKHNKKQIQYKRAISEQYSDYKHPNGLVERVIQYVDLECQIPSRKYEKFKHRADRLYQSDTNYDNEIVQEYFHQGRPDGLKYHRHLLGEASELRSGRVLEFHLSSRLDRFLAAHLDNNHFRLNFVHRHDKLTEIFVEYSSPRKKRAPSIAMDSDKPFVDAEKPFVGAEKAFDSKPVAQRLQAVDSPKPLTPKSVDSPRLAPPKDSPKGETSKSPLSPKKFPISPKSAQVSPKSAQISPKSAQISPKSAQISPKSAQISPKTAQSSPKTAAVSPKTDSVPPKSAAVSPKLDAGDAAKPDAPEGGKSVTYEKGEEVPQLSREEIRSFYVRYDRTPGRPHDEDVSKVIFNLQHGEISVYYHYGDNNITQSYRKFQTSLSPEDFADSIKCYRSDGQSSKPDSPQFLTKLYQTYTTLEVDYLSTINNYVTELRALLNSRKIDKYKPKLQSNIYYLEVDARMKKEYLKEKQAKRDRELKELQLHFDYPEFYVSSVSKAGRESFNEEQIARIKQKCLADLKNIWRKRVEHFENELSRIRADLELDSREDQTAREELINESVIVQRVLEQYKNREVFQQKCAELERSFDAYVKCRAEQQKN
ncbi:hypothetical protein M8J75_006164 [Diaphorina citri]|nr:hypothetical protein M8J75_006164 [Diaphorina citri]